MFAEKLLYMLNLSKISRYKLAKDLNFSYSTVMNWCHGYSEPRAWQLAEICTYLDVSADYLLDLSEYY